MFCPPSTFIIFPPSTFIPASTFIDLKILPTLPVYSSLHVYQRDESNSKMSYFSLCLFNFSADDFSGVYMRSLALVNYTGGVFWPPPTKFRSTCLVDVAFFPFDDQTCILKLGSWLHDGFSVSPFFTHQFKMDEIFPKLHYFFLDYRLHKSRQGKKLQATSRHFFHLMTRLVF